MTLMKRSMRDSQMSASDTGGRPSTSTKQIQEKKTGHITESFYPTSWPGLNFFALDFGLVPLISGKLAAVELLVLLELGLRIGPGLFTELFGAAPRIATAPLFLSFPQLSFPPIGLRGIGESLL